MHRIFLLGLFIIVFDLHAQRTYTVEKIPNPRSTSGYVSDPDQILESAERGRLDEMLNALEKNTSAEYSIVIVNSIGSAVPKDFAVELFNRWGIGKKGKDNGLLLLLVLDQRRWEFETGYGLEGVLPDATLSRMARDTFPPYFRQKKYGEALIQVSDQIIQILNQNVHEIGKSVSEKPAAGIGNQIIEEEFKDLIKAREPQRQRFGIIASGFMLLFTILVFVMRTRIRAKGNPGTQAGVGGDNIILKPLPLLLWIPFVFIWPLIGIVILYWLFYTIEFIAFVGGFADSYLGWILGLIAYVFLGLIALVNRIRRSFAILRENPQPGTAYNLLQSYNGDLIVPLVFFPIGFIPYSLFLKARLALLRSQPRKCTKCDSAMHRLGEKEEDPHLEPGQILEETLGSMDYDVWFCDADSSVLIEKYEKSSRYSKCEKCNYKTSYVMRSWTVTHPTYDGAGQGAEEHECKKCGRKKETTYVIAKLVRASTSSSGSSGYSSGGRSSSSGSSGGSFGGGRSGGGGSGGSW